MMRITTIQPKMSPTTTQPKLTCPHCEQKIRFKTPPREGTKAKCPNCHGRVAYAAYNLNPVSDTYDLAPQELPPPVPPPVRSRPSPVMQSDQGANPPVQASSKSSGGGKGQSWGAVGIFVLVFMAWRLCLLGTGSSQRQADMEARIWARAKELGRDTPEFERMSRKLQAVRGREEGLRRLGALVELNVTNETFRNLAPLE
jgi:hypothetical protein